MNTLELKGGIIEMIAQVDNREVLQRLYRVVQEILENTWAEDYELSAQQEELLAKDIEESYQAVNLLSHEEALKKMAKWRSK